MKSGLLYGLQIRLNKIFIDLSVGKILPTLFYYNGLPVCAMRERVNRYERIFLNMLTSHHVYGKIRMMEKQDI